MEEEASGLQMGLRNGALAQRLLSQPGREGCWDVPRCRLGPSKGAFPMAQSPSPRNHQRRLLRVGVRLGQEWGTRIQLPPHCGPWALSSALGTRGCF